MKRDRMLCKASPTMRVKDSLQVLRPDSQKFAMATNRNRCLTRQRLEHPLMVGQDVVIGNSYSDGMGQSRLDRNALLLHAQTPITNLAKSQVLAYRRSLKQLADDTDMNLGTVYSSPVGSRCLRPMLCAGRSCRSSLRWGKPTTWRRAAVRLFSAACMLTKFEKDVRTCDDN